MLGNFAAYITESRADKQEASQEVPTKIGLIIGQEYPDMNNYIKPSFEMGIKNVNSNITLDFRTIGNWYDRAKARELAADIYANGSDIILTIAEKANQGVITAAKEAKKYVLWYDSNGYDIGQGVVIGSGLIREERAAEEMVTLAIKGRLKKGTSLWAGVHDGYVDFIDDDRTYQKRVSPDIRKKMDKLLKEMRNGNITLPVDHWRR